MSYDIAFKVKVEGIDEYVEVGYCDANTTWNVREMIVKSTGLEWKTAITTDFARILFLTLKKGGAS